MKVKLTKFNSLNKKVILFVILLIIFSIVISGFIVTRVIWYQLTSDYKIENEASIESLSNSLPLMLILYDYNGVEQGIKASLIYENVSYVAVFNDKGTLIRSVAKKGSLTKNLDMEERSITYNGKVIGSFKIGFSKAYIYKEIWKTVQTLTFGLIGFYIILGLAIYLYSTYVIVKPIESFTKTVKEISVANLSKRVNIHRDDEIGVLALRFNKMIKNLQRAYRALKVLSDTNIAILYTADESELLQKVCNIIKNSGYRLVWIGYVRHDKRKTVKPVTQSGYEVGYLETIEITWGDEKSGRGPTGTAIKTGKPAIVKNIQTNPDYALWRGEATKRGYASSAAIPLLSNGDVFGTLNIYAAEPDAFSQDEVKFLNQLAEDLSHGIMVLRIRAEHERTRKVLEHINLILRSIRTVNQLITKEKNIDRLIRLSCENLTKNNGYRSVLIGLFNKSGKVAKVAASCLTEECKGIKKLLREIELPNCVSRAIKQTEPVIIRNPLADCKGCPLKNKHQGGAVLVKQLEHSGKIYGFIFVEVPQEFIDNKEEQSLFNEVSGDIASALYRIELEKKARKTELERGHLLKTEHEQRMLAETLAKATVALTTKTKLDDVFKEILIQTNSLVPHDTSNVEILEGNVLRNVVWRGYKKYGIDDEILACYRQPIEQYEIPGIALKTGKPLIISDVSREPRWIHVKGFSWIKSSISIPIMFRGHPLGVLRLESDKVGRFNEEDAKKLEPLANAAAIAIEKARLLDDMRREIAERKKAEQKISRLLRAEHEQHLRAKTLGKTALALVSKTSLDDVLDEILKQAKHLVPHITSNIALVRGNTLYNARVHGYKKYGIEEFALKNIQPFNEYKIVYEVIKNKKSLIIPDTTKDARWISSKETAWIKSHIAVPIHTRDKILGMLRIDSDTPDKFTQKDAKKLEPLANVAAIAIENARLFDEAQREVLERELIENRLRQSYDKLRETMNDTITAIAKIAEMKDPYTAGHQRRVSQLAVAIAKEIGLPEDKIEGLRIASLMHDIGKINIPSEILTKPTKLSKIEYLLIQNHPKDSYEILKNIKFPWPVAEIALQHHEKINGSGYPQGLSGNDIMLEARIMCVADVVEAMSSHRPYRPALGIEKALEEIEKNKGILYDSEAVDACIELFKKKGFEFK